MEHVVIFGLTGFASRLLQLIQQGHSLTPMQVEGFLVDPQYKTMNEFYGLPVYEYDALSKENFISRGVSLLIALGYRNMNGIKARVYHRALSDGWTIASYVDETAVVRSTLGLGTILLENATVGVRCKLGVGAHLDTSAILAHDDILGDFNYLAPHVTVAGNVTIGHRCFFGASSCIRDGVRVDDETLLGAGGYLSHSTKEPREVYVPARTVCLQKKVVRSRFEAIRIDGYKKESK